MLIGHEEQKVEALRLRFGEERRSGGGEYGSAWDHEYRLQDKGGWRDSMAVS